MTVRTQMLAAAVGAAFLAGIGVASAAGPVNLTQEQQQKLAQDLSSQPAQAAPSGFNAAVGQKVPQSVTLHSLPSSATNQVQSLKGDEFAKFDNQQIVIVDPANRQIMATISANSTTGSATSGSMNSTSGSMKPNSGSMK